MYIAHVQTHQLHSLPCYNFIGMQPAMSDPLKVYPTHHITCPSLRTCFTLYDSHSAVVIVGYDLKKNTTNQQNTLFSHTVHIIQFHNHCTPFKQTSPINKQHTLQ